MNHDSCDGGLEVWTLQRRWAVSPTWNWGKWVIALSLSNLIIIRAGLPGSCPRLWRARQQGSLEHEDVRLLDGGCIEDCKNSCQRRAQKLELLDYLYL